MKKSDKIALTSKSVGDLPKLLADKKKAFFEAKAKQFLGSLKDTSVFKKLRFEIALLSSLIKNHQDVKTK
jgi:ribosomal protein L29